jgi:hypothetical protein
MKPAAPVTRTTLPVEDFTDSAAVRFSIFLQAPHRTTPAAASPFRGGCSHESAKPTPPEVAIANKTAQDPRGLAKCGVVDEPAERRAVLDNRLNGFINLVRNANVLIMALSECSHAHND